MLTASVGWRWQESVGGFGGLPCRLSLVDQGWWWDSVGGDGAEVFRRWRWNGSIRLVLFIINNSRTIK